MKNRSETDRLPRTFWWHNCTQSLGALNDNLFKLLMIYALVSWHGPEAAPNILAAVGFTFALPYLLIVPIAGSFADRYSKHRLIRHLKSAELAVMAIGVLALALASNGLLYLTMFLMSAQSACFGPCKYGIIPEQVSSGQLSRANGLLQLFTFLAIILGTVLAPELSLLLGGRFALAAVACLLIAGLGRVAAAKIAPSPAHPERPIRLNGYKNLLHTFRFVRKDGFLTLAILAAACFSLCAAFIQLNILDYGHDVLGLSHEGATRLFLVTAVGIGIGSLTAGWISGRGIEFGIVPVGAAIMTVCLIVLSQLQSGDLLPAAVTLIFLGFAAGLFVVPLEAFIQYSSPPERTGSIQAANNFCSWVGILLASGLLYLNTNLFGWDAQQGFLLLAVVLISLTLLSLRVLTDFFVKFIVMLITRCCYRLRVHGLENLPNRQLALLVSNHVSLMDAVFLVSCQQRRIRMLMSRRFYDEAGWLTRKIVDLGQVILIHGEDNPKKLLQSLKSARAALDDGYLVCIFAEGALSRTGMMRPFKPGFERIVKGTDYPIIPVYIDGAWETVASYRRGQPQIRPLRDMGTRIRVSFGPPLPPTSSAFEVQQAVRELAADTLTREQDSRHNLATAFVQSARQHWRQLAIADSSGREMSYGKLLLAALHLRGQLRQHGKSPADRIGILLPTGPAAVIANLAIALGHQTSVNLNYTAPPELIASAGQQSGLTCIISSRTFMERFPQIRPTAEVLWIEDLLRPPHWTQKLALWLQARCLPGCWLGLDDRREPDPVATILFSSGSTAEPKGVPLSHNNLLANIHSFRSVLQPRPDDVILATLPLFHSFGYTATCWFPLLSGLSIASHHNPLEAERIGQLAERYHGSLLLTTPSFLVAYARKIQPEQFARLRLVFTGAERLQPRVAGIFAKRFGLTPLEGYGATELSPVCAINMPDVTIDGLDEIGQRPGSVGRPLPGVALRIVHPETAAVLGPGEEGLIEVKGPNVMRGYLDQPEKTAAVLRDGWYATGDMGRLDTDGFLTITGRLSRFSKLGGEMISHGLIESALQAALELESDALAVFAVADDKRGERLCVAHTRPLTPAQIQDCLQQLELPNLWKPAPGNWLCLEKIPLLGSGKIDYAKLRKG